jgi:exonuclease I
VVRNSNRFDHSEGAEVMKQVVAELRLAVQLRELHPKLRAQVFSQRNSAFQEKALRDPPKR